MDFSPQSYGRRQVDAWRWQYLMIRVLGDEVEAREQALCQRADERVRVWEVSPVLANQIWRNSK